MRLKIKDLLKNWDSSIQTSGMVPGKFGASLEPGLFCLVGPKQGIRIFQRFLRLLTPVLIFAILSVPLFASWKKLEPGLELGKFEVRKSTADPLTLIRILRIDPGFFRFQLLNTSAPGNGSLLSAKQWARNNNLAAAINASMYRTDYKTSVSYMRTRDHINNPYLSRDKSILAFDSRVPEGADIRIIDLECEKFDDWRAKYTSFIQSIRMISCKGENVWIQQSRRWSIAAIGTDQSGKVLFIHSIDPNSTHDFINFLLSLPIHINRVMYAEGGAEAQLYVQSRNVEFEFLGVSEAYTSALRFGTTSLPIPNIIGISRK
jgi:uncharacterized protein YigE (DUF2233 family)